MVEFDVIQVNIMTSNIFQMFERMKGTFSLKIKYKDNFRNTSLIDDTFWCIITAFQ